MFITIFTRVCSESYSWATWVQILISYLSEIRFNIILSLMTMSPKWYFFFRFLCWISTLVNSIYPLYAHYEIFQVLSTERTQPREFFDQWTPALPSCFMNRTLTIRARISIMTMKCSVSKIVIDTSEALKLTFVSKGIINFLISV